MWNILDRDLDVRGHHFLEASAGTGKTFAIEHLVTRLFIEHEYLPKELVVMTFTRIAARELKERIFANCSNICEQLMQGESEFPYVQKIVEEGKAHMAIQRIKRALARFEGACITTIHSFCARTLREHALECRVLFSLGETEEEVWMEVVQDGLRECLLALHAPRYSATQLERVRAAYGPSDEDFLEVLAKLYGTDADIPEFPTFQELHESVQTFLRSCGCVQKETFLADFLALAQLYRQMDLPAYANQAERLGIALEKKECSLEEFAEWLGEKNWFFSKWTPLFHKKRAGEDPLLHYPILWQELREKLYPLIVQGSDPKRIALRIAKDARLHIERMQEVQGVFSPDRMMQVLLDALSREGISSILRKQIRAAIIDEFQDTDAVQWEIVKRLFLDCETLYLVGDPKQSIYAFRNADVYTYLSAKKTLGDDALRVLSTNFRATPALVSALNALFSPVQKEGGFFLPKSQERLSLFPVKAGRQAVEEKCNAIHFFCARGTSAKTKVWPTQEIEQGILFPFLIDQVKEIIRKRAVPLQEIAVLVKDRHQAQKVLEQFFVAGIPAHFRRGSRLGTSRGLFLLENAVKAVMNPEDASIVKSFLAGVCARWDAKALVEVSLDDTKEKLHALQQILMNEGCAPFFGVFFTDSFALNGEKVEQKLFKDKDTYKEVRNIIELCCREGSLQGKNLLSFLKQLRRRESSPPMHREGVSVMTIHTSKGLEFDAVFALGLVSRQTTREEWVKVDRVLYPFEPENPVCRQALEELIAEKYRYAYVALTRAKTQLFVPLIFDDQKESVPRWERSPLELLFPGDEQEILSWVNKLTEMGLSTTLAAKFGC